LTIFPHFYGLFAKNPRSVSQKEGIASLFLLLRRQLNIYRLALAWSGAVLIHFVVFARLRAQFINPARAHTATGI
jgi:hypothetical protein